ncbi:hypothetical protein QTQ03_16675 [Micromonospora sp. WMMA1363]|uniref:hypothetical protein n=1 Tax=Micromonospora sp. WMMA1363 TaxID=3053985 RepID=UPI00259C6BEC|nr:hypothetical protein [Micromonospora sp. WMMA1363]MDM4721154.1 hypothetical protein [Micromonospora sp. WMMA1363]
MDLKAVMVEAGTALGAITSLRVYVGAPGKVDVPATGAAAVVPYPTRITYDATYGRGMDRIEQDILLVIGRPTDRVTVDKLTSYAAGAGSDSVKTVLEGHTWTTCDGCRVETVEFDVVQIAAVDHMAAVFTVEFWGQGSA